MAEQSYSIERDLKEAQAMVDGLEDYVQRDDLYVQLGGMFGSGSLPSLTIGALLMRLRRLQALGDRLSPAQRKQLDDVQARHDAIRREWRLHYTEKMAREAKSRLDAMRTFFEECGKDPNMCAGAYLPEALRRTISQELALALEGLNENTTDLKAKMRDTDMKLRRFAPPGEFIWDRTLEPVYPQPTFWWLYARPQAVSRSSSD